MPALPLTHEQHRRLVQLIAERAGILTPLYRETLLDETGLQTFRTRLNFDTDARTFAIQLVRVLQDHGTLEGTGQPALVPLLHTLLERVSGHEDEYNFVVELLQAPTSQPTGSTTATYVWLQSILKGSLVLASLAITLLMIASLGLIRSRESVTGEMHTTAVPSARATVNLVPTEEVSDSSVTLPISPTVSIAPASSVSDAVADDAVIMQATSYVDISGDNASRMEPIVDIDSGSSLYDLALAADNSYLVAATSEGAFIYAVDESSSFPIRDDYFAPKSVGISPDMQTIAFGTSDGSVLMWDVKEKRWLGILGISSGDVWSYPINKVVFTPSGQYIVAASGDSSISFRARDITASDYIHLDEHTSSVTSLTVSYNGYWMASGSEDGMVQLWSLALPAVIPMDTYQAHSGSVLDVAFSREGDLLASSSIDGTIRVWSIKEGDVIQTLRGHRGAVNSIVFSSDGQLLVSGGEDGTIRLWNFAADDTFQVLYEFSASAEAVVISYDGKFLTAASRNGLIRFWGVPEG